MTQKENMLTDEELCAVTGGAPELETGLPQKNVDIILSGIEEQTCPKCGKKHNGGHDCIGIGPQYRD